MLKTQTLRIISQTQTIDELETANTYDKKQIKICELKAPKSENKGNIHKLLNPKAYNPKTVQRKNPQNLRVWTPQIL